MRNISKQARDFRTASALKEGIEELEREGEAAAMHAALVSGGDLNQNLEPRGGLNRLDEDGEDESSNTGGIGDGDDGDGELKVGEVRWVVGAGTHSDIGDFAVFGFRTLVEAQDDFDKDENNDGYDSTETDDENAEHRSTTKASTTKNNKKGKRKGGSDEEDMDEDDDGFGGRLKQEHQEHQPIMVECYELRLEPKAREQEPLTLTLRVDQLDLNSDDAKLLRQQGLLTGGKKQKLVLERKKMREALSSSENDDKIDKDEDEKQHKRGSKNNEKKEAAAKKKKTGSVDDKALGAAISRALTKTLSG